MKRFLDFHLRANPCMTTSHMPLLRSLMVPPRTVTIYKIGVGMGF